MFIYTVNLQNKADCIAFLGENKEVLLGYDPTRNLHYPKI